METSTENVTVGKTGNNERTYIDLAGRIIVRYHQTDIIIADPETEITTVSNGGYSTHSTTVHINRSLKRLSTEVSWIPWVQVSQAGGRLQINKDHYFNYGIIITAIRNTRRNYGTVQEFDIAIA